MTSMTLEQHNRAELAALLTDDAWIVACLCADWCDVCRAFRPEFNQLAELHADVRFVWIDIEDQADVVGDFDIENFPTLLIQRGDMVYFFGTMLPDQRLLERLLLAQIENFDPSESKTELQGFNLRKLLG